MKYTLSRKGIASALLFILLIFLYMLILPFGDEPDFNRRGYQYLLGFKSLGWDYFDGLFPIVISIHDHLINTHSYCIANQDSLQLFGRFDIASCFQDIRLSVKRSLLTISIFLPLLIIVTRKVTVPVVRPAGRAHQGDYSHTTTQPTIIHPRTEPSDVCSLIGGDAKRTLKKRQFPFKTGDVWPILGVAEGQLACPSVPACVPGARVVIVTFRVVILGV